MSKGVRAVVAVAAAVAIPFVAPAIATSISTSIGLSTAIGGAWGGTIGGGLVGSALGAGTAALTKQNVLLGALGGGAAGAIGGYNQLGNYLTGAAPALPPGVSPGSAAVAQNINASVAGSGFVPPAYAQPTGLLGRIGEAASRELGGNPIRTVMSAGQLAYTLYNKPPDQLLPHEQQQVAEMAQLAQTNRELFDQRLVEAQSMIRMGTPKPEEAFGQAQGQVQRGVAESARGRPAGLRTAAERAGTIEATRQGTLAAARDAETAAKTRAAGVAMLPTSAPATSSMMSAPLYEGQERRQYEYGKDLAQSIGAFGGSFTGPRTERIIEYRPYNPTA